MANMDYLHTAEILRAVSPHIHGNMHPTISLFASMMELLGSLKSLRFDSVSAQSIHAEPVDVEALLNSIRPILHEQERGFVDQLLNFLNIKRTMDTYQEMMQMMDAMQMMNEEQAPPNEEFVKTQSDENAYEENPSEIENDNILFGHQIAEEIKTSKNSQDSSSFSTNEQMLEMLKTMLPNDKAEMLDTMNEIMKGR